MPAVRPACSGETLRASPPSGPLPTHLRPTHTALHFQLRLNPADDIAVIADRLATQYGWTAAERQQLIEKMYDIRRTTLLDTVHDRVHIPVNRTPANVDAFLTAIDDRFVEAQRQLRDLDDH